jgi:hypothetical protein
MFLDYDDVLGGNERLWNTWLGAGRGISAF